MSESSAIKHIAFIMDGNRRWAKAKGLPTLEGHRRGYDKTKEVGDWCLARGIEHMTLYAFSTENWDRSEEEIAYLMDLFHLALTRELDEYNRRGIRLRIIGRRERLPEKVLRAIDQAEAETKQNSKGTLYLAINYGGRAELIDATKKMIAAGVDPETITEEGIRQYLYAPEAPYPDLIVRTSGEQRLSGFLSWQGAYSELFFSPVTWPDFSETHLGEALDWFANRQRRFGK